MPYRVVIIESRNIIKEGLIRILKKINSDIEVIDFDKPQALVKESFEEVDVVFIDYALLFSETKVVKRLKKMYPKTHFIGITNYICERMSLDFIEDMVYLNDNAESIKAILQNLIEESSLTPVELSDREREILRLLAMGKNTKSIANHLYISPHTVTTHKRNILKKTKKNNVVELVSFAYEKGIL
ncbi:MAG: hypothetical protein CR968_00865 [Flavobacteriia bacterium]|nr:MAG: hypothetical protein CR968_00865 [Flavobacteriia bacterium]